MLQELQVDQRAGHETKEEKTYYLSCLVKAASQIGHKQRKNNFPGLSFTTESGILLSKRFHILMENDSTKRHNKSSLVLISVCMLVLFSFFFIFEAHYSSPENAKDGIELTPDNCYVIQKEDGTYDFYLNLSPSLPIMNPLFL